MAKELNVHVRQTGAEAAAAGLGKVDKSVQQLIGRYLTIAGAAMALKKVWDFTVVAAAAEEKQIRSLQTAVKLSGESYENLKPEIDGVISSLQAMTEFGDDETRPALITLIQLTNDTRKSLALLPLVTDIAATGLYDMASAARYVAMAQEGNVMMLSRYIMELRAENNAIIANGTASEKAAEAMRILNEKFGGTAQENLKSTAAQLARFKNYLGDMGETIGSYTLPAINALIGGFHDFVVAIQETQLETVIRQLTELGAAAEILSRLEKIKLSTELRDINEQLEKNSIWKYYKNIDNLKSANIALIELEKKFTLNLEQRGALEEKKFATEKEYQDLKGTGSLAENNQRRIQMNGFEDSMRIRLAENAQARKGLEEERKNLTANINLLVRQDSLKTSLLELEGKGIKKKKEETTATIDATAAFINEVDALKGYIGIGPELEQTAEAISAIITEMDALREYSGAGPFLPMDETAKQIQQATNAMRGFTSNLGQALVYGQNLGDAVVSSLKAIAAEIVADAALWAILTLITGGASEVGKFLPFLIKSITGFAGGGDFIATKPQLIMVGEGSRPERVSINPVGAQTKAGVTNIFNFNGVWTEETFLRDVLIPKLNRVTADGGISLA